MGHFLTGENREAVVEKWESLGVGGLWRPTFDSGTVIGGNAYVGNWSGRGGVPGIPSDTDGTGTIHKPFATIRAAASNIARANPTTVSIRLAPGTFDLPFVDGYNWVDIIGYTSDGPAMTISTGTTPVTANEELISFAVTGLTTTTVDELRGTLIQWTSGSPNNRRGWIRRSDITGTTAAGETVLTVSQDDLSSVRVPPSGGTLKILNLDSTVHLPQFFHIFQNSVQCNLRQLVMTDDAGGINVMFSVNTDKIGCEDVLFKLGRVQVGRGGGVEFLNCYLANLGHATRGMLAVLRNGDCLLLRGTVVDGDLRATVNSNRFVEVANAGKVSFDGNCVFMGLNAQGIQCDGADFASQGELGPHYAFSFDDCEAGFVINGQTSGLAGWYQLPNLHGEVDSTYAVVAEECACVEIGPTSSIRTLSGAGVVNAISADAGASAIAGGPDGAHIEGGVPAFTGYAVRYDRSFVNADLAADVLTVAHNLGQKYVHVTVYDNNDTILFPTAVLAVDAVTADVDLTGLTPISGTWHVVVSG